MLGSRWYHFLVSLYPNSLLSMAISSQSDTCGGDLGARSRSKSCSIWMYIEGIPTVLHAVCSVTFDKRSRWDKPWLISLTCPSCTWLFLTGDSWQGMWHYCLPPLLCHWLSHPAGYLNSSCPSGNIFFLPLSLWFSRLACFWDEHLIVLGAGLIHN